MEKIVWWDFDGVLADSLKECYAVTQRVVDREAGLLQHAVGKELAPYSLEEFAADRPVCVNAADFFVSYVARRKHGAAGEAERGRVHADRPLLEELDRVYYEERARFSSELKGKYPETMPPYAGVLETLLQLKENGVRQAVMTARDSGSVDEWLRHYGVRACVETIVGTEVSRADRGLKGKQVHLLKKHFGSGEYWFVDDIAHNLEVVHATDSKIRLVFAAWGYGKSKPEQALNGSTPKTVVELVR
jgi:phosphoglycolate phosphatase-like HAD superfamily hydrolase